MSDGDVGPPAIPSMSKHLELMLQKALDQGRSHAVRACQANGLPALPTPVCQSEDVDGPKGTK